LFGVMGIKLAAEIPPTPFSASIKLDHHHGLKLEFTSQVFRMLAAFP